MNTDSRRAGSRQGARPGTLIVLVTLGALLAPRAAAGASATAVSAGTSHTCAVTSDGALLCWGDNTYGQLGDGTTASRSTPAVVSGLGSGVVAVAAGEWHTCAVISGGAVKCWGYNEFGQLGDGTTALRATPVPVSGLESGAAAVDAGSAHSCALTSGGEVRCWGFNYYGQLGDGTATDRWTPVTVSGHGSGMVAMSTGGYHSCAVASDGAVRCWGYNHYGQVGDGTTTDRQAPVTVSGLSSGMVSVSAGAVHTCAVTSGGAARCWGFNYYGQLGDGTTWPTQRPTPVQVSGFSSGLSGISASFSHTCAVTSGGAAWCWGRNVDGQVGDGTTTDRSVPVAVSGLSTGVAAAAAGGKHTCAVTATGAVACWGANSVGQLGDGTTAGRLTAATVVGFEGVVVPTLASVSPARGPSAGGRSVTLAGTGFVAGETLVTFGGNPATSVVVTNATALTATTPAHAAETVDVVLTTPGGSATKTLAFTYENVATGRSLEFEGDLSTDVSVYRPSTGDWHVLRSSSGFSTAMPTVRFGQPGDVPLMGDFDGDGRRDIAVYRPATGTWFWLKSSVNNTEVQYLGWGMEAEGDVPVPGDYDGDGKTDPTVFRPATGTWFVLESRAGYSTWRWHGWGAPADVPMPGDYDGDGWSDVAVYRPATGTWFVLTSASGFTTGPPARVFGQPGDVPVRGDFDGDGKADHAIYRPATGTWFWLKSSVNNTEYAYVGWGVEAQGDVPVPGDYDGDGKTDPTVFRAPYGTWFILKSGTGFSQYLALGWGVATDTPLGGTR